MARSALLRGTVVQLYQCSTGSIAVSVDKLPDTCPVCHMGIVAQPRHIDTEGVNRQENLQIVFQCTKSTCRTHFIANYLVVKEQQTSHINVFYTLDSLLPKTAQPIHHSDILIEVSPTAIQILNQVALAEATDLDQLAGIGLRKALEFMVKDFAIRQEPAKADEIRKKMLGACIDSYITDVNVKACAKRAAWLGNDETHYTRKWADRDIQDLHLLIKLTMNAIENVILTEKYIAEMPE